MNVYRALVILAMLISCGPAAAQWTGKWEAKGSDAIIGLTTEPSNPYTARNGLFAIGYSKSFNCQPVISFLSIQGMALGEPVSQKTSKSKKNQMIVVVSGSEFTSETKMTKYTNGIELAMMGGQNLVSALSNPRSPFVVKIGDTVLMKFDSAENFPSANSLALARCS